VLRIESDGVVALLAAAVLAACGVGLVVNSVRPKRFAGDSEVRQNFWTRIMGGWAMVDTAVFVYWWNTGNGMSDHSITSICTLMGVPLLALGLAALYES
jgi:hypothetical protein